VRLGDDIVLEDRTVLVSYYWTAAAGLAGGTWWWSNPDNWGNPIAPGVLATTTTPPGAGDDVILGISGGLGTNNNSTVDQGFTGTIRSLNIVAGYGTLKLTRSLTIAGTGPASAQAGGTITADTLQLLTVSAGTFNVSAGTMNNINLTMASGSTLSVTGGSTTNSTLTNNGTATLNGAGVGFGTLTNGGTLSLQGGCGCGGVGAVTNTGTINQVSDSNLLRDLDNKGAIVINGGQLKLSGSPRQTGAGASITFNGGGLWVVAGAAALQLQAGNVFGSASGSTISGSVSNSGATIYAGGNTGTLEITGTYNQGSGGFLNIGVDVTNKTNSMLKVDGTSTLAGGLIVKWSNGTPAVGSTWNVASFGGGTGGTDFTAVTGMNGPAPTHVANTWDPYTVKV
jgi:filamentous hemagglutinin